MAGLNATFKADFAPFYEAVKKAEVQLKSFSDGAERVGTTINRMADSFSGRKIIQEAHLMTAAMVEAGGMTTLTDKELRKLGATVGEAAEKMRKLGIDVPPGFQKIEQAVKAIEPPAASMSSTFKTATGVVASLAGALGLAFTGAAIVNGIKNQIASVADYADSLAKLKARTELSYRDLQILEDVGLSSGVSIEALANAVQILQQRLGDGTARRGIQALGLSFDELKRATPAEQLTKIGSAIAAIQDPTERAEVAARIFGRAWKEILPALRANMAEAAAAATTVGDAQIDAADRAGDRWAKFWNDQKRGWASWAGNIVLNFEKGMASFDEASRRAAAIRSGGGALPQLPTAPSVRVGLGAFVNDVIDPTMISNLKLYGKTLDDTVRSSNEAASAAKKHADEVSNLVNRLGGQQAIGNANAWMKALTQIGGLDKITRADHVELTKVLDAALAAYQRLGKQAPEAMQKLADAARLPLESTNLVANSLGQGPASLAGTISDLNDNILPSYAATLFRATDHIDGLGRVITTQAVPALGELRIEFEQANDKAKKMPPLMGSVNKALSGIEDVLGGVQTKWANMAVVAARAIDAVSTKLSEGDWVGAIVAAGAALGQFISKLFKSEESAKVSPLRDVFFKAAGGLDVLNPKVEQLTGSLQLVENIFKAKTVDQYNKAIKELNDLLEFQTQAMATLDETAKKYNLTIEEMGPAWQRQELDKKAQELFQDYQILTGAGVDNVVVLGKMSDAVNTYVRNALKMGVEVPIAMRPMLQAMVDQGLLTDAAGTKITSLEDAGVSFAMTMSEGFKSLIAEVQKLTDAIARGLGLAIKNIPDADFEIRGRYIPPKDMPQDFPVIPMAVGGSGIIRKPTLFLAGENGPEEFAFSGSNKRFAGATAVGDSSIGWTTLADRMASIERNLERRDRLQYRRMVMAWKDAVAH